MTRHIFILLPASVPTGPVRGAWALANVLVRERAVTVVTLRSGQVEHASLDGRVQQICLADRTTFRAKVAAYRELLEAAGGRNRTASISMCLSADTVNLLCRNQTVTCASVRGNLPRNYRADYGLIGLLPAAVHLASLRAMDHVVAMSEAMARQVARFCGSRTHVIGNFVDEAALECHRSDRAPGGPLRLVFLGSLTRRKQPLLAVSAVAKMRERSEPVILDMVGDGPLRAALEEEIARLGLRECVRLHGFQSSPYGLLASADVLVLPSLSEGISRACLEALHLGVPCVLREVDGNSELIRSDVNGMLFSRDEALVEAVVAAGDLSRRRGSRQSLLPDAFRQDTCGRSYLQVVEGQCD